MTSPASVGGDDRLRLFLALQLPGDVLDVLEPWQAAHLEKGRMVARDALHVTLAFLGSRPSSELPSIVDALRDAVAGSRRIVLEPSAWRETRSVGMVVLTDAGGEAAALAGRLHSRLETLGVYRPEARAWLPHVTVLRYRERPRLSAPLPETGTFVPSGAAAYLSRLRPSGARYEVLEGVSLNAGG
jgi:RNA 2',3'-cyclic 3'-phosphodiesterase